MRDTVLLTGATGFLGTELAAGLIRSPETCVFALVRAADEKEAAQRLRAAWQHMKELYDAVGVRVFPVPGDFTKPLPGMNGSPGGFDRRALEAVTLVIHAGAEIGFQTDGQELEKVNTLGTKEMLAFAATLPQLRRFVYISTAYVAGQKSGTVTEEEPAGSSFSSLYEKSKAQAEALVRRSGLPFSVCRPGMMIGNSRTGWVRNFNTVYYVLRRMLLGKLKVLPISADTALNVIPVDKVAEDILTICACADAEGKTFHLTCPAEAAPRAGELADYVRAWAEENLGVRLPRPVFMPLPALEKAGLFYNKKESGRTKGTVTNYLTLLPYFYGKQIFDRSNTDRIAGEFTLHWRDYMDTLLTFACRKNFMRQTGQTVFEQARVRRVSRRYPVNYYDVTAEGIRRVSGPEVNRRIDRIVNALWAWGIRRGDRVALTGINSVSYLALEQAIGLTGAVSVPIYYTTPAQEASLLLERSGAVMFFVGDRRMLEQLPDIHTSAKVVAFSAALKSLKEIEPDEKGEQLKAVMPFGRFLKRGTEPAPVQHPDPSDLATIRYTSGTTGEPKGVMFSFRQLSWMGEVLTNLLTWEDRNRSMRYLSFLPLSHVVEGILASYAPYYVLAKVDYYYLNDFGSLTDALPKVRPNVFFSVPRFYEKLWDQVCANPLGKAFLSAPAGPGKRALAEVLRRVLLKKAGLDACGQLIVGSAPVSEELLLNFRSLGIEIHNAYGQTEAPLITINRLGDNIIPTIGTPLPETEVTQAADGELIVKGPQVALGYYGMETDTIRDGVLMTGDLGVIHENGHITLYGRKKDMVVTAYGKNISIPKLEELLKNIPGVSEAVLIGENRPYCTALLWPEGEIPDLQSQIDRMNKQLSHPEQIRAFRVISRPLSIQAEELTPNLKVKRANVQAHFAKEIEEMYR